VQPVTTALPQNLQPRPQAAAKKRKKKKTPASYVQPAGDVTAVVQPIVPQPVAPHPETPLGGLEDPPPSATVAQTTKAKKGGRCWKYAVNTHATKDYKWFIIVWFVIMLLILLYSVLF
jgi:hypothetical protein